MRNMLKTAWRNIRHQQLHSVINIGGLAVAMTAVVLIMMWVLNELRFDNFHPDADRIYHVKMITKYDDQPDRVRENSPYGLHEAITQKVPEVEKVAHALRSNQNALTLKTNNKEFNVEWAVYTDKNWFDIFHYDFLEGSAENLFAHPFSIALTQSKAKMLFGNKDALNRSVQIDSTNFIVAAVLAENPINSSFQFDVIMPMAAELRTPAKQKEFDYWGNISCKTFVKLRPGTDAARAADKISALFKDQRVTQKVTAALLPLRLLHFDNDIQRSAFVHGSAANVRIFIVLGIALLLAAGINYVNLSVARAGLRIKEIGVRKIVGADRGQLFFQLMSESFLTSVMALIITVLLVNICLPFFNRFTGVPFTFNIAEPHMALLLGGVLLSILLLTGIYPALLLSSFNPLQLFSGRTVIRTKNAILGKGLIVTQFAFAVMMTIGAVVIYKQMKFVQHQQADYSRSQVFSVRTPQKPLFKILREKIDLLGPVKQELAALSQVKHVSRANISSPVNNTHELHGGLDWDGKPENFDPSYTAFDADIDLQKIMNFQFVQGQWFENSSSQDVILNETAVKQFGIPEPVIGRRFKNGQIVGVVRDFYFKSMHEKIGPAVISLYPSPFISLMIHTQPGAAIPVLQAARAIYKKHFPGEPFLYSFLDEEFEKLYREDRKAASFTMIFSGLSIFISCIGLLGLITLAAAQRKKEIGIRKVLGAGVRSIVLLVSRDYVKLIFIAICIASPIAWYAMNKWLQDFAYRIEVEWWMFALAGGMAILIAVITLGFQSVKAALGNPVKSLRTE